MFCNKNIIVLFWMFDSSRCVKLLHQSQWFSPGVLYWHSVNCLSNDSVSTVKTSWDTCNLFSLNTYLLCGSRACSSCCRLNWASRKPLGQKVIEFTTLLTYLTGNSITRLGSGVFALFFFLYLKPGLHPQCAWEAFFSFHIFLLFSDSCQYPIVHSAKRHYMTQGERFHSDIKPCLTKGLIQVKTFT